MTPVEEEIIRRKLAAIVENLKALEPISLMTQTEYLEDLYKRKAAERLLQELIEAAIDINTYIIVQTGHAGPDDYYESFIKVGALRIISSDLAEKLVPSAGLRNRLVHEYNMLEHSVVLDAVRKTEELYTQYVRQVENYIQKGQNAR
jgi:uncharacterized protein YutE (UPF0331/DUF86 family)